MVFREKVMPFSQPGAPPASALESVTKNVRQLDMAEVRREIVAGEAAERATPWLESPVSADGRVQVVG